MAALLIKNGSIDKQNFILDIIGIDLNTANEVTEHIHTYNE